jgi:CubicO group peptidase (beta-lactamase class C family)
MESGGAGLFSTATDYAKLLQAVLSDKLVKKETTEHVFTPKLMIAKYFHDMFAPEVPRGIELNYSVSGIINMGDVSGKRRKGSMM